MGGSEDDDAQEVKGACFLGDVDRYPRHAARGIISPMKKLVRITVALFFLVIGVALTLHRLDPSALKASLRGARWGWVAAATAAALLGLMARGYRWRLLTGGDLRWTEATGIIGIGYLVSNLVPLRMGDVAKALVTSWRSSFSAAAALSAMVIERTLDLLAVALLLLATLPFIPALASARRAGLMAAAGTVALLSAFVALVRLDLGRWSFPRRLQPLVRRLLALQGELAVMGAWRRWPPILFWTALTWGGVALSFTLALRAFGVAAPLGGAVVTWATAFGMALPSPGGIGTFHEAIRLALTEGFGIADETAVAYAIVAHLINYFLGSFVGIVALSSWGLSLGMLTSAAEGP